MTLLLDVGGLAGYHSPKRKAEPAPYAHWQDKGDSDFEKALAAEEWETLQTLIEADPALLSARTWRGTTALLEAARAGNVAMAEWLLTRGADVNHKADAGSTALSEAAGARKWELCYLLLKKWGANPTIGAENSYNSIVHIAARSWQGTDGGELEVLHELAKLGVNLAMPTDDGATLLSISASAGSLEGVRYALALGMGPNQIVGESGLTPALEAATRGHMLVARELLARGGTFRRPVKLAAEPLADGLEDGAYDNQEETLGRALLAAVRDGQLDDLRMLLEQGGLDINSRDWTGDTVLVEAARLGKTEVVDYLIAHGAEVDHANERGETALLAAVGSARPEATAIVLALLAAGAELHATNKERMGVAHYAALAGKLDVLQLLGEKGAALNMPNVRADTPLLLAARRGKAKALQFLIGAGARADAVGSRGEGCAILAVRARSMEALALCLNAGALPTRANERGDTPMHEAARVGLTSAVATLAWSISRADGAQVRAGGVPAPDGSAEALADLVGEKRAALTSALAARNAMGSTPLLAANSPGKRQVIDLLISLDVEEEDRRFM
eukprot:CAMPEP_0179895204 /NCGR_PEP_ID=MMETSP0982-20121206/35697_1 /TAXON_ID=483367 /ORGANISM="non described non described, Strain CCMP 2436" /LENGTH=562 /DNA_ID=CAMNT_0021791851 /DNA_START=18 /DNA_END=1706 /DNA_ORIENTATION=+